uniref:Uncharacterized protein n=1 Tax=Sciurus vulgaris TaxID=55149 RepID=A0A8D2DZ56_SCIVU
LPRYPQCTSGREDGGGLLTAQPAGFGSGKPVVSPTPCPSPLPLSSACDTHTDGNNFFQLRQKRERPAACASRGFSLLFWLQRLVPLTLIPLVLPFKFLCIRVSLSLIHHPRSSVPVLLCDGNVLVNCVSNRLCVYVCLWGWFIPFTGH